MICKTCNKEISGRDYHIFASQIKSTFIDFKNKVDDENLKEYIMVAFNKVNKDIEHIRTKFF